MNVSRSNGQSTQRLKKAGRDTDVSCLFELEWHSKNATHTDCHFQQRLNVWQDCLPPELEALMTGKNVGWSTTSRFEPGRLVPEYQHRQRFKVAHDLFSQHAVKAGINKAQLGRFYPKRFIAGTHGIYTQDITPMRVTGVETELDLDLNHPLSHFDLSLTTNIIDISSYQRHGGACHDIADLVSTRPASSGGR